jgi:hypothetical protein
MSAATTESSVRQYVELVAPNGDDRLFDDANEHFLLDGQLFIESPEGECHRRELAESLLTQGWTTRPCTIRKLLADLSWAGPYALQGRIESKCGVHLSENAVVNVGRIIGMAQGLQLAGKEKDAVYIVRELVRALSYVNRTSYETVAYNDTEYQMARHQVKIFAEDAMSFGFVTYVLVPPTEFDAAVHHRVKERDEAWCVAERAVIDGMRIDKELDRGFARYSRWYNGGIICRLPDSLPFAIGKSYRAWSIHT